MHCELDHLVVGCADLAQGVSWAVHTLGVAPQPGGRHAVMGTHNVLLALGPRCYLELIAIDPLAPPPARMRWFALDDAAQRARLHERPRLLAWVVGCDELDAAVAQVPALGRVLAMARGDFRWRIAVRDDGAPPLDGALPVPIAWEGSAHPVDRLEESRLRLQALEVVHPQPLAVQESWRALGLAAPPSLLGGPAALRARLHTPRGALLLD
ncbi:MAG: VOC family protein [Burkholderiaceae bacterium]|nr:VOC family protein [Burkholderiaceae bacterium]